MYDNLLTIGIPSKGRLKQGSLDYFENNGFKIINSGSERNYFGTIEGMPFIKIIFLHAKEIIGRLSDDSLDLGISGLDLLLEAGTYIKNKIEIKKKLDFGKANLVVAIPKDWIDVQTVADLEEVCFSFTNKHSSRLRIATKYPNLSNEFLFSKGVTQYKLVNSIGSTEIYPFTGSSEIVTDITSTGKTLEDNNLRVLKDGIILKSEACLLMSKKKRPKDSAFFKYLNWKLNYIPMPPMPPMPGIPPPIGGIPPPAPPESLSSGLSPIIASVVISKLDIEAASCKAVLTTFVGSIIPFAIMSQNSAP